MTSISFFLFTSLWSCPLRFWDLASSCTVAFTIETRSCRNKILSSSTELGRGFLARTVCFASRKFCATTGLSTPASDVSSPPHVSCTAPW